MASDIATLGIKVELNGADQAKRGLDGLSKSASGAEISVRNLTKAELEQAAVSRGMTLEEARKAAKIADATAAFKAETAAIAAAAKASAAMAAEQKALAASTVAAEGAITGMSAAVLPETIAILAAFTAMSAIWHKFADNADADSERAADAMKSLRGEIAKTKTSMADLAVLGAQAEVQAARRRLAAVQEAHTVVTPTGVTVQAKTSGSAADKRAIDAAQEALDAALTNQRAAEREAERSSNESYNNQLSSLVQFNNATALERKNALARLKDYEREAASLQKSGLDNQKRLFDLEQAATLRASLFPKAKREGKSQEEKDLEAQQKAMDKYYSALNQHQIDALNAAKNTHAQNDQLRDLIAAYEQGPAAVEALEIAQAGQNAVAKLGVGVSEQAAAAVRREAEEHERLAIALGHTKDAQVEAARAAKQAADEARRENERRARELQRATASAIEQGVTDFANGVDPFRALEDALRRAVIRAFSEAVAARAIAKAVAVFSTGESTGAHGGIADASVSMRDAAFYQKLAKGAGAAVGGFAVGNSIGQATGSGVAGAIGGAASGFMLGNAILPGIGGAVGGLAGFVGGIIGAGDAARHAAEQLKAARASFQNAFDAAKAEVNHDDLGQQVAAVHQQYDQLREAAKATSSIIDRMLANKNFGSYAQKLAELNRLEEQRIEQLKEEAAAIVQKRQDDLDVRTLRNQGRQHDADVLQKQKDDAREYAEAVQNHMSDAYLSQLKWNQSVEEAAVAAGTFAGALNAATSALHNAPTGFKVEPYTFQFGAARPRTFTQTGFPQTPNGGGPQLSRAPVTIAPTIAPVFHIDGTKTTREQVNNIALELRKIVADTLGKDAPVWQAWGELA